MDLGLVLIIGLALAFDFINGFHDSANSIATVVSTRVLTPKQAVIWAAFFNFIAFLVFELHVANTVGKGIVNPAIVDRSIIVATLLGASIWDLLTWYWGLPTSSSHALMGGFIGAALVKVGTSALVWKGIIKTVTFMFSPVLRLTMGDLGVAVWGFRRCAFARGRHLPQGTLISAALYSLGHGGSRRRPWASSRSYFLVRPYRADLPVPFWVVLSCHAAMGLSTLFGGWRIVKTMGQRWPSCGRGRVLR